MVLNILEFASHHHGLLQDYMSPAFENAVDLVEPMLQHAWSAAFSFAKCHIEESAPYDVFAPYASTVEQFSRYARLWTRGYDTYVPTRNVVFHDYETQPNGHGNNEWVKRRRDRFREAAIKRVKTVLQMQDGDSSIQSQSNLGIYGIGKRRSLAQFEKFVNMDLMRRLGNEDSRKICVGREFVSYDTSISPVDNMFDSPNDLDPQPLFPLRSNLTYYLRVEINNNGVTPELVHNIEAAAARGDSVDAVINEALEAVAAQKSGRNQAFRRSFEQTSSLPDFGILFFLWLLGLVLWYWMFVPLAGNGTHRTAKPKSRSFKDV
jgi:hypothetical protein